jgi:hypothetical protein
MAQSSSALRSTALSHGRGNCPVLPEGLRHLVKAEHHGKNNEEEGDSEDAATGVKTAKNETQ